MGTTALLRTCVERWMLQVQDLVPYPRFTQSTVGPRRRTHEHDERVAQVQAFARGRLSSGSGTKQSRQAKRVLCFRQLPTYVQQIGRPGPLRARTQAHTQPGSCPSPLEKVVFRVCLRETRLKLSLTVYIHCKCMGSEIYEQRVVLQA